MSTLTATPAARAPARARTGRAGGAGGAGGAARGGAPEAGAPRRITRHPQTLFDGAGGGPTLDDVLSGAWEELTAHAVVECPVCSGELAPEYGAHARPIGGRCRTCATTLS
ncbi:MAG TPA: hypothetical protein VG186_00395 [Solirubrobacteraceae bacterium]|nr:hypothetical protein [Solirubrobacteraceae bacterium]